MFCAFTAEVAAHKQSGDTEWHQGYTLITMSNADIASANKARDYVTSRGGTIAVLLPPHIMLGWVPPEIADSLVGNYGIESVTDNPLNLTQLKYRDEGSLAAANFFNAVVTGSLEKEAAFSAQSTRHLAKDVLGSQPEFDLEGYKENLSGTGVESSPANSDSMLGTVAVTLFFVESDGSIDPNSYTWNPTHQQDTINRSMSGLSWWSRQATAYGKSVSFTVFYYSATSAETQQGYEPIRHSTSEDSLWINPIMAKLGYNSGDRFARVAAFNTWLRSWAGTNWAYSVFIGYNPSSAADKFTDGYAAYVPYLGAPYTQMLFRNFGNETNFGLVLAHETGHIFWACDEYYEPGYGGCAPQSNPCSTSCAANGPRPGVTNGNCQSCNPNPSACKMLASEQDAVCPFTRAQIGWNQQSTFSKTPFDFDGDRKTDIAVYRDSDGYWHITKSSNNTTTYRLWGVRNLGDVPVPGDYDGDGKTDYAVYRNSDGYWHIIKSSNNTTMYQVWGVRSLRDVPVSGDFDGDGKSDIAVYRASDGYWHIRRSSNNTTTHPLWGVPSLDDMPVPGDYDGDSKTDIAVYRNSDGYWHIVRSSNGSTAYEKWGVPGLRDVPVQGDYDGDGKTDIAVYRPSDGYWFIINSSNGSRTSRQWGVQSVGDIPVPGDYDGDGKTDIAVYRNSDGYWFVLKSSDGTMMTPPRQWGVWQLGDIPVPSAFFRR